MESMGLSSFTDFIGKNEIGDSIFYHSSFRGNWCRTLERDKSGENIETWIEYEKKKQFYLCDDLKSILKGMDVHPDNQDANRKLFEENIKEFPVVSIEQVPAPYTWYNRTTKCINLRPGRLGGSNRLPAPIRMCGQNSHAIIGGRTGSGKSVFVNNLILNMMAEYPPWELELYLADFKKVELSRYMNKYPAPHVRVCAATSEIDYVQSLIYYIKDKKDDREKLFARLGYLNIEEFRNAYCDDTREVIMPRILFLVDEFQQLFLDADTFQKSVIDDLITDITRKGRSQGVHLMFASQDMSGALNQKQLSNFKVHFALACEAGVSGEILGNNGAVSLETGQVIANTKSKELADNVLYSVPIAENDPEISHSNNEEYFYSLLKEYMQYAAQTGYEYSKSQKFYHEDKLMEMDKLHTLLENDKIKKIRTFNNQKEFLQSYFMSLILGRKVTYSTAEYDIENFFIDYAKNRCLLCLSGNTSDLAYFQKLVAVNLKTMDISREANNISDVNRRFAMPYFYDLNPLVSSLYPAKERLKDLDCLEKSFNEYNENDIKKIIEENFYYRAEDLKFVYTAFSGRKNIVEMLRSPAYSNAKELCIAYLRTYMSNMKITDAEKQEEYINFICAAGLNNLKEDDSNICSFMNELDFMGELQEKIRGVLQAYYRYKKLNIQPTYKLFPPVTVWISGIENLEKLPSWFAEFASDGMNYNFLTMFFSASGVRYDVKQASNYIFVAGNDPKIYDDYLGKKPPKGNNEIKFQCLIKNTNQKFAFKKYRCQLSEQMMKAINFDEILT